MPTPAQWRVTIIEESAMRPDPIRAHTFEKCFVSHSQPALLICSDNRRYVVKGAQKQRVLINDQVMGLLGVAMNAPVAPVALVDVPAELIALQSEFRASGMIAGVSHGSLYRSDVSKNREDFAHTMIPENRVGFARLAIMYGWAGVFTDHQFFYHDSDPRQVLSFDHGHFFPGGPNWTIATLRGTGRAIPDNVIVSACGTTAGEIEAAKLGLRAVSDLVIARAVAAPHDHWGILLDERVELATFLAKRRDELLA